MHQYTDEWLFNELKAGSELAFTEIYNRFYNRLHIEAKYKLHDIEEAADVVHDVFTSLWTIKKKLPTEIPLKRYLLRAVNNRCIDIKRKETVFLNSLERFYDLKEIVTRFSLIENKELANQLRIAVNDIPSAQRRAFKLAYFEDKTYKEIVDITGTSPQNIKNLITSALKNLRKKLGYLQNT